MDTPLIRIRSIVIAKSFNQWYGFRIFYLLRRDKNKE